MIGKSIAAGLTVAALAFAGCGGSGTTPILTATPAARSATPTVAPPTPTPVPVPPQPASFRDYALTIASYLSAKPAAGAGDACLHDLYQAWSMPYYSGDRSCRGVAADQDPAAHVVAVLVTPGSADSAGAQFTVDVFEHRNGAYVVAYESSLNAPPPAPSNWLGNVIVDAGDLLGDGGFEVAYLTGDCGASTCFDSVHIVRAAPSGYAAITPAEGITMSFAQIKLENRDGDGAKELVITGGTAGSVGAGPQRERTEIWDWNGTKYALTSTTFEPATFLYHAVKDADALFDAGNYAAAEAAYVAVVGNTQLEIWRERSNERDELEAYVLLRAALAELMSGGNAAVATGYLDRASAYPDAMHAQLAAAFRAAYAAKSNIGVGCAAVRDMLAANDAAYRAFWDFGYGNPQFDPAKMCPF